MKIFGSNRSSKSRSVSWLQPTSDYHCRTPHPFFGKWDTCVQGKHDRWTKCSEPEFCLPFDKMLKLPGKKPWVSWKYIRIRSNVQGHTPGSRKYQNHNNIITLIITFIYTAQIQLYSFQMREEKSSSLEQAITYTDSNTKFRHAHYRHFHRFNFDRLTNVKKGYVYPVVHSLGNA